MKQVNRRKSNIISYAWGPQQAVEASMPFGAEKCNGAWGFQGVEGNSQAAKKSRGSVIRRLPCHADWSFR